MTEPVDVVLPAGGRMEAAFAQAVGVEAKTLIRLEGETVLRRILTALRGSGRVGCIVVIGSDAVQREALAGGATAALAEGAGATENIVRGLEWQQAHGAAAQVLIATGDLPFLTPDAVSQYLDLCSPKTDFSIPIIERQAFEATFPDTGSVWVRLKEGEVTNGCLFLVRPEALHRARPYLDRAFEARKSNLAMARLLGVPFILRYVTGRLSIAHIEARCRQVLNCDGAAVRNAPPELAFDLDDAAEYAYAQAWIARQKERAR